MPKTVVDSFRLIESRVSFPQGKQHEQGVVASQSHEYDGLFTPLRRASTTSSAKVRFRPRTGKLDTELMKTIDVDRIVETTDIDTLQVWMHWSSVHLLEH